VKYKKLIGGKMLKKMVTIIFALLIITSIFAEKKKLAVLDYYSNDADADYFLGKYYTGKSICHTLLKTV
jgi:hypothetical protein